MTQSFLPEKLSVQQIGKIPFFNDFTGEDLEQVSKILKVCKFDKGTYVIKESDVAKELFFILEGSVKILKKSFKGQEEAVGGLHSHQFFGEMALIDGGTRSASIIAETDVILAELIWDDFQKIFADKPEVTIKVLKYIALTLSMRLRKTNAIFATIHPNFKNLEGHTTII